MKNLYKEENKYVIDKLSMDIFIEYKPEKDCFYFEEYNDIMKNQFGKSVRKLISDTRFNYIDVDRTNPGIDIFNNEDLSF